MKQGELDKALRSAVRDVAKLRGWKASGGFLLKSTEFLFFTIIVTASKKSTSLSYLALRKPLPFDDLFWKIMDLEENATKPLSFRAAGVFTAPMNTFAKGLVEISDLEPSSLRTGVGKILEICEPEISRMEGEIGSPDEYIKMLETSAPELDEKKAGKTIWIDRLLAAILIEKFDVARSIVQDRKAAGDNGGFLSGSDMKTFYDLADQYLDRTA
ncbi:MAG TPA: hypothetical protein VJV05_01575 [Pyrinomonadaceae bacterium]|nr:hypothetical protein [Pyrinomonadaceae bacterium]